MIFCFAATAPTVIYTLSLHDALPISLLENDEWDNWVTIEGYSAKQDEHPDPHMQFYSPGFFKTLKIPVLLGRDFNERDIDRKSTRLNSSHVEISYAVFCLKKKKKRQT